jgi:hypothetical protein
LRTDVFEVTEDMGGDQNGDAFSMQLLELAAKFDASDGVESRRRFIQQQDLGIVD